MVTLSLLHKVLGFLPKTVDAFRHNEAISSSSRILDAEHVITRWGSNQIINFSDELFLAMHSFLLKEKYTFQKFFDVTLFLRVKRWGMNHSDVIIGGSKFNPISVVMVIQDPGHGKQLFALNKKVQNRM
ncbi:hypothetical protein CEXT_513311 [Caerostris extrusa]|uniref:Uncharacterized protein n=1 Tax=Caerostris extrusa TaxID=172846 RepID=A0AAV4VB69_CAEEX|nr:hypothetical protein CEXT_513311 [Caerostris extrusa]